MVAHDMRTVPAAEMSCSRVIMLRPRSPSTIAHAELLEWLQCLGTSLDCYYWLVDQKICDASTGPDEFIGV